MKSFLFILIILLSQQAWTSFELGVGTTSVTSGRVIPALNGVLTFSDLAFSATSTGVKSSLYHQSAYLLGVYKVWNSGSFIWGDVHAGFGAGVFFINGGLKPDIQSAESKWQDFGFGPSFRIIWNALGPAYFGLEATLGLKSPWSHLLLSFQDFVVFSFGIKI